MRKLTAITLICLGLVGTPAVAGPGHDHDQGHGHSHGPVAGNVASEKAAKKIEQLVQAGKIDASWAGVKPVSVEQKTFANGPEWVITFKNDRVKETSKQTLYLFFSLDGHYIAANHTGE